jgi:hypothetical protein
VGMISSQRHKQVLAKVNAYVDEGIKKLVEVLNTFDGVCTTESCQGSKGQMAFVYFQYGRNSYLGREINREEFIAMAEFVHKLAVSYSRLALLRNTETRTEGNLAGIGMTLDISMDWGGNMDTPYVKLSVPCNQVETVTGIFLRLQHETERHSSYRQQLRR